MTERLYHIGQMNHAILRHDEGDPRVAGFVDNLDLINGLAERSKGCLYRMSNDEFAAEAKFSNKADEFLTIPRNTVTVSAWESPEALKLFVYKTLHGRFVNRRDEWFIPQGKAVFVLWKIPVGSRPTLTEAIDRLTHLREYGPSETAFDFDTYQQFCSEAEAA